MKFIIILSSIICLCFFSAKAQPITGAYGCMSKTSPTRVYQLPVGTHSGLNTYESQGGVQYSEWTTQYDITTYPCVSWVPVTGNGCYIRSGTSSYTYTLGNYGYFTGVYGTSCPIDDYIFPFAGIIAGLSFYQIRRRYLFS